MELPSLAVGIGLQGKPIDRAQLNYLREKGAEEAKVKKAAVKDKELEGYRKKLFDTGAKAMNPIDRERIRTKSAEFFKTLSETEGDLDQAAVSNMLFDIQEDASRAGKTYDGIQRVKANKAYSPHQEGVSIIETATTPEEANERFKMTPGSRYASVNENGVVNMPTYAYIATPKAVNEFIKGNLQSYLNPTFQGDVNKVAGKDFVTKVLKPGASEAAFAAIKNSPEMLNNAEWDYGQQLQRSGQMPDLSTPEGNAAFDAGVDDFIKGQIAINFDPRSMDVGIGKPMSITNIVNTGDKTLQPGGTYATRIIAKYNNGEFEVQSPWTKSMGDEKMTIQPNITLFRTDGQPVNPTDYKDVTYNTTGVNYTLDKDYTLKNTFIAKDRNGNDIEFKKGQVFKKGSLVPAGAEEGIAKEGTEFSAKPIAFGQAADGTWYYQQSAGTLQSRMAGANKTDREDYQKGYDKQTEMQRQVNEWRKQRNAAGTPGYKGATPAPAPSGKPKGTGVKAGKTKTDKEQAESQNMKDLAD
jgi:hypothetical protein